jgi:AraC-like DNA-binding protein
MTNYTTELLHISSYLIGILLGALLFSVMLLIHYRRKLNRLVKAEYDFEERKLTVASAVSIEPEEEHRADAPADIDTPLSTVSGEMPTPPETVKRVTKAELAEERLFNEVTKAILEERLYLKQGFGRTDIVERFNISAHRAGMIFSNRQTSIPEFVCNCRLDHARRLMADEPLASLADIAAASGFTHLSTFMRDFKSKYGMTPARYRETIHPNNPQAV